MYQQGDKQQPLTVSANSPTEKEGIKPLQQKDQKSSVISRPLTGKISVCLMIWWTSTCGTEPSQGQEMWGINLLKRTQRIFLSLATFKYCESQIKNCLFFFFRSKPPFASDYVLVRFQGISRVTEAQKYLPLAEPPRTQHGFVVYHI